MIPPQKERPFSIYIAGAKKKTEPLKLYISGFLTVKTSKYLRPISKEVET